MKMPIAAVLLFVSTAALGQPVFNNPPSSSSSSGSGDVVGVVVVGVEGGGVYPFDVAEGLVSGIH